MEHAQGPEQARRRGVLGVHAHTGGFDRDESHARFVEVVVVSARGVGAPPHAGDYRGGQLAAGMLAELRAYLGADHGLKARDEVGVRVRPNDRADDVVRVLGVVDPVANRLVGGVFERFTPRVGGPHLRAEHAHARYVRRLPLDVDGPHVHDALQAFERAHRRRSNPVLAGTRLGDDAGFTEPLGQ